MSGERRLDELLDTLAGARPALDDVTRARVGAAIQAQLRTPAPSALADGDGDDALEDSLEDEREDDEPASHRARRRRLADDGAPVHGALGRGRWLIAAVAAAVVLVIAGLALHGGAASQVAVVPTLHDIDGFDGELLLSTRGGAARGDVDGAALTLYGPGKAVRHGRRIDVDAEAVVVDRSAGAADLPAMELTMRSVTIRVQHAMFSVDSYPERVTVIRGELLLSCRGSKDQPVSAGSSATCNDGEAKRAPVPVAPLPAAGSGDRRVTAAVDRGPRMVATVHEAPAEAPRRPTANAPAAGVSAASGRYTAAEHLMANDPAAASAALRALVASDPQSPEAAPALLDLARLAAEAGDAVSAHAALNELPSHPGAAALALPAAYLRCALEHGEHSRNSCLAGFRAAFPDSPRDAEILAHLALSAVRAGDCDEALPLLKEYKRRYPDGPSAARLRDARAECVKRAEADRARDAAADGAEQE